MPTSCTMLSCPSRAFAAAMGSIDVLSIGAARSRGEVHERAPKIAVAAPIRERPMSGDQGFPFLQTARLDLREASVEDAAAYHDILVRAAVTRYINLRDSPSPERSRKFVRWMSRLHAKGSGCAWILAPRDTRTLVGAIRIDSIDTRSRCGRIGYELHPAYWGRGLMSEALDALVTHAYARFELNRLEAWTLPGNGASDRVLLKSGFRYEGTLRQRARFKGSFHDLRMFGRLASDVRPSVPRTRREALAS